MPAPHQEARRHTCWNTRARQAPLQVTALDVDPVRCERIHDTLQRLGLQAQVLVADAGAPARLVAAALCRCAV